MEINYDDLSIEELQKRLELIKEEIDDLDTEFEFTFEAGHIHISPAELELEKDALRRDKDKLSKEKEKIEEIIEKREEKS